MNDEELVEVIARWMHLYDGGEGEDAWRALVEVDQGAYWEDGRSLLAALRSAGFQVFRPEDCETVWRQRSVLGLRPAFDDKGQRIVEEYRLVPADSGESG